MASSPPETNLGAELRPIDGVGPAHLEPDRHRGAHDEVVRRTRPAISCQALSETGRTAAK
jgi:hypothetical protein